MCAISSFRLEVEENGALLGCYAGSSCNFIPTFRDNLSRPSARVKNRRKKKKNEEEEEEEEEEDEDEKKKKKKKKKTENLDS